MPRYLPSLIAALIVSALLAKAVGNFRQLAAEPDVSFYGPGEFHFAAPVASDFTIWHNSTASIDGIYSVREPRLPPGAEISILHAGEIVPTRANGSNYHSGGEAGDKTSVLYFKATEPGDYLIQVSGLKERHAFSISRGQGVGRIFALIGWIMATGFTFVLFLTFLVLALLKVFPKPPKPTPPLLASP